MMNKKAQVSAIILIFIVMLIFALVGMFIIKGVNQMKADEIKNAPPDEFGENIPADEPKDVVKKLENKTIAPDTLAIG